MLFAVRFEDDPDRHDVRTKHMAGHLEFLAKHKDTVRVAGSLRRSPGENPVGGLWVVEADDKRAVEALFSEDPFWTNGLRRSVEILHWSKAFPDQQVPV